MVLLFSRKSILGIDAFPFSVKRELVLGTRIAIQLISSITSGTI